MKIEEQYIELIDRFRSIKGKYRYDNYVAFHPMKGNEYQEEIMFIGRALNGWKWCFSLKEYESTDLREFYQKIQENGIEDEIANQLNWVKDLWKADTEYKTSRSAFWRTIRHIVIGANIGNELNWNQKIVWSNLFKISNTKGNPRSSLMKLTREESKELLESEIEVYNPSVIIFLTGLNWFRKLFEINPLEINGNGNYIEHSGILKFSNREYKFLVTPHPQGKRESILANEVVKEIETCTLPRLFI